MAYDNTNKGAIWIKTAKSGLVYKSGRINVEWKEYNISMFDNDKGDNPNRPDFNVILEPTEEQNNNSSQQNNDTAPIPQDNSDHSKKEDISVEDIPF